MTLDRRVILLIFPVLLIGYALAATLVYLAERNAVMQSEAARLERQIAALDMAYQSDETVARSVLAALIAAPELPLFLHDHGDNARIDALATRLEQTVTALMGDRNAFASLAVFASDRRMTYYHDNSGDPFAGISQEQVNLAGRQLGGQASPSRDVYLTDGHSSLMVVGSIIDGEASSDADVPPGRRAALVQVAIRPLRLLDTWSKIEAAYHTPIEMGDQPLPSSDGLAASGRIGSSTYVRIAPNADYLHRILTRLEVFLIAGTLAISLVSIGLLLLLIRAFVTRPIAELDRQVTEIVMGDREAFDVASHSGAEVRRLQDNVRTLHEQTLDSLARIRAASYTDTLTSISNRAHFNVLAEEALEQAKGANTPLTLLFLDVHHFKLVNDRYGHAIGDAVLAGIARAVERAVLQHVHVGKPLVARLSGDEFGVLLPLAEREASPIADAILDLFSGGFAIGHDFYPVGISIGLATYPDHARSVQELVANADAAMYEAKARGRNHAVHFSDEIETERGRARLIQGEMTRIVPDVEFHLVYMPICDRSGTVGACEALLRWTSPTFGPISPGEFMPLAERNGMFAEIDRWVVDHALADYGRLAGALGPSPFLSINVSSAELTEASLAPFLRERIRTYGVPASRIVIELTETVALENENVFTSIVALRSEGVHIAMDDFGVGFTSVLNLLQYEIDTIKLDRYFLDHLIERKSIGTLRALISLCHAENMRVVAEGIDSEEKWELLMAAGCDYFQGFGIGPPMTIAEIAAWAAAGNIHRDARRAMEPADMPADEK